MRMNPLFGVFIVLVALLAMICALFIGTQARAPAEEAGIQNQREEIFCATIEMIDQVCTTSGRELSFEFQGCSALLTYTQVRHEESGLDAEIVEAQTIGACTAQSRAVDTIPPWEGGWRGGDQDSRFAPALA